MTSYKDAGVDITAGERASRAAARHAAATFAGRRGMIGEPLVEDDSFAGLLDMGDFYVVQTTDGTGTKIDVAMQTGKCDTLGYDLLAMVADDAVCVGAEVISVSNCLDIPRIDADVLDQLLEGLSNACREQSIVIPAGEIAEVPGAVTRGVWSATAIGMVEKDKVINPETIEVGDIVIALRCRVARSNGFSLIRKILTDAHGDNWHSTEWRNGVSWGEILLTPSIIYHSAILSLIGRYGQVRNVNVKGIAHITGGGIRSKLARILRKANVGAELKNLWKPHDAMQDLIKLGNVPTKEAYRTWNMGSGMLLVVSPVDADRTCDMLSSQNIEARPAGTITKDPSITITVFDGTTLTFPTMER